MHVIYIIRSNHRKRQKARTGLIVCTALLPKVLCKTCCQCNCQSGLALAFYYLTSLLFYPTLKMGISWSYHPPTQPSTGRSRRHQNANQTGTTTNPAIQPASSKATQAGPAAKENKKGQGTTASSSTANPTSQRRIIDFDVYVGDYESMCESLDPIYDHAKSLGKDSKERLEYRLRLIKARHPKLPPRPAPVPGYFGEDRWTPRMILPYLEDELIYADIPGDDLWYRDHAKVWSHHGYDPRTEKEKNRWEEQLVVGS